MNFVIFTFFLLAILLSGLYLLFRNGVLVRLLTLGYMTNVIVAFICFYGVASGNKSYIDVALIYALISPIATIVIIRFLKGEK